MDVYKLSSKCKKDLANIYEYSIENFGLVQAQKYLNELHILFERLGQNIVLGRNANLLSKNLMKRKYNSHIVFIKY